MNHFPLSSHHQFTKEELIVYLSLFPGHALNVLHRANRTFISSHHLPDGLSIRLSWRSFPDTPLPSMLSYERLETLYHQKGVELLGGNIITYSNNPFAPTAQAEELFTRSFAHKMLLSDDHYHELEYHVAEATTTSDDFFVALSRSSFNYLLFHRYLEQQKKR